MADEKNSHYNFRKRISLEKRRRKYIKTEEYPSKKKKTESSEESSDYSSEDSSEDSSGYDPSSDEPIPEKSIVIDSLKEDSKESSKLSSESSSESSSGSEESSSGGYIASLEDDEYDPNAEYFKLDPAPLVSIIHKRLVKKFPGLPQEGLYKSITSALERAQEDIVQEYCGVTPKDERWKTDVNDADIEKLEPQLKAIRDEIEKEKPTLKKILEANIMSSEKKRAIEMYDILGNTEPYTHQFQYTEKSIKNLLRNEVEDPQKIKEYEEKESRLKKNVGDVISRLKKRILDLNATEEVKTRIYELFLQMEALPESDQKSSMREKIMWAVSLPHQNIVLPEIHLKGCSIQEKANYCQKVYTTLDSKLYGMTIVKERLIQILHNRLMNPKTKSMLALEGPPGVGKSAIAKALADSTGLPFEKISLGGLEDPGMLTGQDNSWVGSTPSIILQILKRMKCCNGIILFDELDKLSNSPKGRSVQHVLLHITDYIQNKEFQDSYLYEFPHDLSQIWFMFAMNESKCLDSALRDRLDIIKLEKYNQKDVAIIIQRHVLPAVVKDIGLSEGSITISDQACNTLSSILAPQMKNSGLRAAEKELHRMVSRISFFNTNSHSENKIKLSYNLPEFEGFPHKITSQEISNLYQNPGVNLDYLRMYG